MNNQDGAEVILGELTTDHVLELLKVQRAADSAEWVLLWLLEKLKGEPWTFTFGESQRSEDGPVLLLQPATGGDRCTGPLSFMLSLFSCF